MFYKIHEDILVFIPGFNWDWMFQFQFKRPSIILCNMKRICSILCLLLILVKSFASEVSSEEESKTREIDPVKQYLIGIHILNSSKDIPEEEKLAYYKKLIKITGITSDSALTYLSRFENKPQKWLPEIDSIVRFFNKTK